jgi:hypothetical protein
MPGEKQSQAAIDLINSTSAKGVVLYGGKTTLTQVDAALSGEIFQLPAGRSWPPSAPTCAAKSTSSTATCAPRKPVRPS